jgi:hypothetical protein
VDAVADEDKHPRRPIAIVVVPMPAVGMRLRALQSLVPAVPLTGPSSLHRALSAAVVTAVVPVASTLVASTWVASTLIASTLIVASLVVASLVVASLVVAAVVPVTPTLVVAAAVVTTVVPVAPTLVLAVAVAATVVPVAPTLVVAAAVVATVVPVAPTLAVAALVVAALVVPVPTMTIALRTVVVPAGVAVLPMVVTALACQPRRVARREGATRNSRLAADIAGKCDVLGGALGSQDLHAMAFPAVIVRERVRDPVRHSVCRDLTLARIFVLMRMRVPPKHELLDDEEHAEPDHQRSANAVRPARPHGLHRFGQ